MTPAAPVSAPDILVVDDDPVSRDLLVLMLQSADVRVTTACDGRDAVDIIQGRREGTFEAVFTDVQMPRMNGLELLDWLNINTPTTATVIMTASQERDLVSASLRGGAVEFLDKPFDMRAVLRAARQARETHRRRTQQRAAAQRLLDIADINQRLTRSVLGSGGHNANNIKLSTRFYAIDEASGDLIKATVLDANRVMLVLGDVSGHGLKEGFLSAYFQGIIEGMAHQAANCHSIAESFNRFLNEQWNDQNQMSIGTSLSACFLEVDLAARRVSVLNCGSPGVMLSNRRGAVESLAPGGSPLGWFLEIEPKKVTAALDTAGLLQLWSDGLEAHAERIGIPPLALAYRILQAPPHSLADTLLKGADDDIVACRLEWCSPQAGAPFDDVWIPIQRETLPGDSAGRIDEVQGSWSRICRFALPQMGEDLIHDITLCLREALLNALDHGCDNDKVKHAHLELLVDGTASFLHARITDEGAGFDTTTAPSGRDPEHISLGLQVIRSLTHATRHSEDGRTIEMTFCLTPATTP